MPKMFGYAVYNFREKDPAVYLLRTAVEDQLGHRITKRDLKENHYNGGPKSGTSFAMFFGDTLHPRNSTLERTGAVYGLKREWVVDRSIIPSKKKLERWRRDFDVPKPRELNGKRNGHK